MKTLEKTMTEYVLGMDGIFADPDMMIAYAKLLSTPLTLAMFLPCDEDGNVLEEPKITDKKYSPENNAVFRFEEKAFKLHKEAFQQAKERVLFEGFHLQHQTSRFKTVSDGRIQITLDQYGFYLEPHDSVDGERIETIEDLIRYNLTLTENALKNIL